MGDEIAIATGYASQGDLFVYNKRNGHYISWLDLPIRLFSVLYEVSLMRLDEIGVSVAAVQQRMAELAAYSEADAFRIATLETVGYVPYVVVSDVRRGDLVTLRRVGNEHMR